MLFDISCPASLPHRKGQHVSVQEGYQIFLGAVSCSKGPAATDQWGVGGVCEVAMGRAATIALPT